MGLGDFSFSAVSREAVKFMWPSMVLVTVGYALWARRLLTARPSRRTLVIAWLAAAVSAMILAALAAMTLQASDGSDVSRQAYWYILVERPLPASMTFAGLQLIAFVRPRGGWISVTIVGVSALAAGLVTALRFWTAPILFAPFDWFPPLTIWGITSASMAIGYALALPLWLTALRRERT